MRDGTSRFSVPLQVYLGSILCSSLLETNDFLVPALCNRNYALLNGCPASKICPFFYISSGANVACKNADVLETKTVFLNHICSEFSAD
jgi:hypothetical protein